jgi:AhpD family alkylhydroperoxidase
MDERTKELIAVGTSIAVHCQPCLSFHVGKARELGIDEESINEAIAVGKTVERGAMDAIKKHSMDILNVNLKDGKATAPSCHCGK